MTSWDVWADGVLNGISAPVSSANIDTLWAWSGAESGTVNRMRWQNPLNTTWYMPNATPMNTIPVWRYATVQDGITATVKTLLDGYYPLIVSHLRNSVPRQQWADCCPQLGTWGTGCGWLGASYGMYTGSLGDNDLTAREHELLVGLVSQFIDISETTNPPAIKLELDAIKAAVAAIQAPAPATVDLSPVLAAIAALKTDVDAIKARVEKDLA